ncbi:hypothetical protein OSB04_031473 [Centaurea solstitialis]|uniref:Galactose oxidase n=1 Tax=Centaurea solstitialis TaxID=347529 RepID=A0AA38S9J8_9ASTR|nr:hypothetical protein OSB04_031473 [Centaurea solstitialis]
MASIKLCFFLLTLFLFSSLILAIMDHEDPNYITDDGNEGCTIGASPPGASPKASPPGPAPDGAGGGGGGGKDCPNKNKGKGGGGDAAPADGGTTPPSPDGKDGGKGAGPDGKGADGAPPPGAAPGDGQGGGGGGGGGKDCPNKNKGQGGGGGGDAAPADGKGGDGATPSPDGKDGGKGAGPDGKDGGKGAGPDGKGGDGATPSPDGKDGGKGAGPDGKGADGASPTPDGQGGGGGGGGGKDCPNKNKGQGGGGGDAAPADGKGGDSSAPPSPDGKDGGKGAGPDGKDGGKGAGPDAKDGGKGAGPDAKDGGKGAGPDAKDGGKGAGPDAKDGGIGGRKECPNKGKKGGDGGGGKGGMYGGHDVKEPFYQPQLYQNPRWSRNTWIDNPNVGVAAMQYQLMPNNKAVWFDTTNLGPSALELGPKGNCPPNPDTNNEPDCFAHAVTYDIESGTVVPVYIRTDPWCSSGHMLPNGDLMSTGGNKMGFKSIRILKKDDPAPTFVEKENALGANRWYPSNCVLEDGTAAVVGGRDAYSYDLVPPQIDGKVQTFDFPFLQQTTDPPAGQGLYVENNLYPFIFLLPDGNVFIFANNRAVAFDPKTGKVVKEYPQLDGARNYPASGMSALFPLRLSPKFDQPVNVEIVVCGGNTKDAINQVDKRYTQNRVFTPALADCNRIKPMADKPAWEKEQDMPTPRTMGDLLVLPNGQFLLINGAKKGCSGWEDGEDPNLTPTVYMPEMEMGKRFKELQPTTIPRMYHSVSSVLPNGQILVAGSNAHQFYTFDGPYYPTELRVEKFSPHYLDPALDKQRPAIDPKGTDVVLKYGKPFKVVYTMPSNDNLGYGDIIVTLLYPPFTTHGFSQNQRLLIAGVDGIDKNTISAVAPPSGKIAPPGYYLLFVVDRGVPSQGVWVHID